ncbi:acyl carrier protein [Streptomyces nogalater]
MCRRCCSRSTGSRPRPAASWTARRCPRRLSRRGRPAESAAEETVARVWRDLFKSDGIASDADFYQLGGTSLQFTRLVNRLRKATGRDLALADLLTATTIADQARLLDTRNDGSGPDDGYGAADSHGADDTYRPVPQDDETGLPDGPVPLPRTGPLPCPSASAGCGCWTG